jgi:glyoxylase-like metal-dependent hydrolase (beta-lactamase superfamily II)
MAVIPKKTENGVRVGDVEFIWARNSREFFFSNSILILDPLATLVDPSANFSYLEHLASQNKVQQVLNTHYHVDHRSLNSMFRDAKFMCHRLDVKPLTSFENYLQFADQETDSGYIQWLKGIFSSLDIKESYFSVQLKDKDLLPLKSQTVEVVHLPGHTPGHIGLFFKDIDALFVSDVDLTPLGPWYANISSDIDQFLQSIERLKNFQCTYYVSSHGSRIYDREAFLSKLLRFGSAFEKRDNFILENLKGRPQTQKELSRIGIIYKAVHLEKDPLKASFERQMIGKHLERLEKQGILYQEAGLWHLK